MNLIKETGKIILIYFIASVVYLILTRVLSKSYFTTIFDLRKYWIAVIMFSCVFLILVRLFKVKFESIVIFLVIIMFLLLYLILNKDFFISYLGSTPEPLKYPYITFIAIWTTIPFQGVIWTLVGYDMGKLIDIIVPVYLMIMGVGSYFVIKFKKRR